MKDAIDRLLWPVLRDAGFDTFAARDAWRRHDDRIDRVRVEALGPEGIAAASHSGAVVSSASFLVDVLVWLRYASDFTEDEALAPEIAVGDLRTRVLKGIEQPRPLHARAIWYVTPTGPSLERCLADAAVQVRRQALPWLTRWSDPREVLRTALEDDEDGPDGTSGWGRRGSLRQLELVAAVADHVGDVNLASQARREHELLLTAAVGRNADAEASSDG